MGVILIVEDDLDLREELCGELSDCGFNVVSASNGLEAIERIFAYRPDLIVSDISMAGLDGLGLVRRIREGPADMRSTPVILLSAFTDQRHRDAGLAGGADAYLTKPIDVDFLIAEIRARIGAADLQQAEARRALSDETEAQTADVLK